MITITSDRHIIVLYELQFYSPAGEFLGRRLITRKRLAEQIMNIWKKHGFDVNLRKLNKLEWFLVNPADIEKEER